VRQYMEWANPRHHHNPRFRFEFEPLKPVEYFKYNIKQFNNKINNINKNKKKIKVKYEDLLKVSLEQLFGIIAPSDVRESIVARYVDYFDRLKQKEPPENAMTDTIRLARSLRGHIAYYMDKLGEGGVIVFKRLTSPPPNLKGECDYVSQKSFQHTHSSGNCTSTATIHIVLCRDPNGLYVVKESAWPIAATCVPPRTPTEKKQAQTGTEKPKPYPNLPPPNKQIKVSPPKPPIKTPGHPSGQKPGTPITPPPPPRNITIPEKPIKHRFETQPRPEQPGQPSTGKPVKITPIFRIPEENQKPKISIPENPRYRFKQRKEEERGGGISII